MDILDSCKIAVAIPCYNEELTIGKVIRDFRQELPMADIYVFDNNSTDRTADLARRHGAIVVREKRQGKGCVMQSIFEKIDADIYVLADGDDTYPAEEVHKLLEPIINEEADMTVGTRLEHATDSSLKRLHQFGNRLLTATLNMVFKSKFRDILSGYRVFNRVFAKNVPLIMPGFETETELTLQALEKGFVIKEVPVTYRNRPNGSNSKLRTWADGYRILLTIAILLRDHRPLYFFSSLAFLFFGGGAVSALLWLKLPDNLVLPGIGALLVLIAFLFLSTGLILNAVSTRFKELTALERKNLYYSIVNGRRKNANGYPRKRRVQSVWS
jgi:glycosyltransferase involved in cell wall biosynthesis